MTSDIKMLQLNLFFSPRFCDSTHVCALCMSHGNITIYCLPEFCRPLWIPISSLSSSPAVLSVVCCTSGCGVFRVVLVLVCVSVCVAYEMLGMPRGCSAVVSHLCCPLCCCWFAVPLAALRMLSACSPAPLPHSKDPSCFPFSDLNF